MSALFGMPFFTGINYWESKHATRMWHEFSPEIVEEDMKVMAEAGIDSLRVFPLWPDFQPLTVAYAESYDGEYEFMLNGEHLPDTPAGKAGVSEEACRNFETFCALAEKYHLKLVVGLVTGHMSFENFLPPAFVRRDIYTDPTVIKWLLRYVRYFVGRMKNQPAIVGWDLGNEVANMLQKKDTPDAFHVWCRAIADTIRLADPSRPVVTGFASQGGIKGRFDLTEISEYADVHTVHPYNIFELREETICSMMSFLNLAFGTRFAEDISGLPTFLQEFGAIGYLTCTEKEEALFYRGALATAFAYGCHGLMWWCAFDQGSIDFSPYDFNNIGSQYGFFREDRSPKLIAAENNIFRALTAAFPEGLPPMIRDAVVLVPRDDDKSVYPYARTAFGLLKRAGLDPTFAYALDPIPDSDLYFLPGVKSGKAITKRRWSELLEKVRAGATLYLSLDGALFREIPETAGVMVHSRVARNKHHDLTLNGKLLPFDTAIEYEAEPTTAKVLAYDADGKPFFFENDLGKGKVFFSLISPEAAALGHQGFFYDEVAPAYEEFYRAAASSVLSKKLIAVASPFIASTEHEKADGTRLVSFINFSPKERSAVLDCKGHTLTPLSGPEITGNTLTLPPVGLAVYEVK